MKNLIIKGGIVSEYEHAVIWAEKLAVGANAILLEFEGDSIETATKVTMTPAKVKSLISYNDPSKKDDFLRKVQDIIEHTTALATAEFVTKSPNVSYYIEIEKTMDEQPVEHLEMENVSVG